MAETWAVIRRDFSAFVRTRAYLLGTLFGPVLIAVTLFLPVYFMGGAGDSTIAIIDRTQTGLGARVAAMLATSPGVESTDEEQGRTTAQVFEPASAAADSLAAALRGWTVADSLDGVLLLPGGLLGGEAALYEGENATNFAQMGEIQAALQRAVQGVRLEAAGIDPAAVGAAFRRVELDVRKVDERAARGAPESLLFLAQFMGFIVYFLVILYGYAVARGVQEEKRDRIVEILLSSIPAERLMAGKVFGVAAAALLQISIWTAFAALALTAGKDLLAGLGARIFELPQVPASAALVFLFFFAAGFFLYACLYAAVGAVATTDQEVQQLQLPMLLPLMIGFFMTFAVYTDPESPAAVAGSLIPFTSPIVMPIRATIAAVPPIQMAASMALLVATCGLLLWLGGKIYRVSILATGKRPSASDLWRWVRAG